MSAASFDPLGTTPALEPAQALDACCAALRSLPADPAAATTLTSVVELWRNAALRWVRQNPPPAEVARQLDRLIDARLPDLLGRLDRDERARTVRVVDRLGAWAVAGLDDAAAACALAEDLRDRIPTRLQRTRRAQAKRRRGPQRASSVWVASHAAADPATEARQVAAALKTGEIEGDLAVGAVTRLLTTLRRTRAAGPLTELATGLLEAPPPVRQRFAPAVVSAGLAVAGPHLDARGEAWRLLLRCLALSPQDPRLVRRVEAAVVERSGRRRRFAALVACGFILASAAALALQLPA